MNETKFIPEDGDAYGDYVVCDKRGAVVASIAKRKFGWFVEYYDGTQPVFISK